MPERKPSRSPGRPFRVERLAEVDSTNRHLAEAARAGAAEGLVVVADHQTAGRGRLGRRWDAVPGSSLLVSVLLRPRRPAEELHLCTAAVALAMADAVADAAGFRPELKWPNDLIVAGRKLAGVLAEAEVAAGGSVRAVVVGVGVNVTGDAFPAELSESATACEVEAGRPVDRAALLDAFLRHLATRLAEPDPALLANYRRGLATIGQRVRVDRIDQSVEGLAVDVDPSGGLVVQLDDGRLLTVGAGDVIHLRPA